MVHWGRNEGEESRPLCRGDILLKVEQGVDAVEFDELVNPVNWL